MECLKCGNCKTDSLIYFCVAKNDFVIKDDVDVKEKQRASAGWKKGECRHDARRKTVRMADET